MTKITGPLRMKKEVEEGKGKKRVRWEGKKMKLCSMTHGSGTNNKRWMTNKTTLAE